MTPLVLDCSVAMAWCFEDECDELADAALDALGTTDVWVPSLWPLEVANVLLVAERRGRLTPAASARFVELLRGLPILVDDGTHDRALGSVLWTARETDLSSCDAAYLDLAIRRGASMATRDSRLRAACAALGVPLFEPA